MGKRKSEGGSSTGKVATMCVYCGSSPGNSPAYKEAAIELASLLVKRNIDLVYGGGSIGLMGEVARAVHNGGCHVLGIVPKKILPHEIVGSAVGEVLYVDSMHQRKERMYSLSDAFIALPGGFGTMEELLEIITWAQIGIHNKPIGLLNVDGYYNFLLNMIDNAVEKGFISQSARNILIDASNATDLMKKLGARSSSKTRPRHASPSSIEPNL